MKHSVDISAILVHFVWKIFFIIPHITTIFPRRIRHLLLFSSLTTVLVIPEQVWVHGDPLKGGKKHSCGSFLLLDIADYVSTHREISDSTESYCPCEVFLTRKWRCLCPWRSLRDCPPLGCVGEGQAAPRWCCWALARRCICHRDEEEVGMGEQAIGEFLEPYVPPGWYWLYLRMCPDCKHEIISMAITTIMHITLWGTDYYTYFKLSFKVPCPRLYTQ